VTTRRTTLTERSALLSHPVFLIALGLLIANDWLFKPLFHNALTGKLSDFAGLFAFAFFWSVAAGRRIGVIHALTGIVFAIWKSPLSQPAIDAWNAMHWNGLAPMTIARVVDAGDLLALLVLPWSWRLVSRMLAAMPAGQRSCAPVHSPRDRIVKYAIAGIALVAFTATSKAPIGFPIEADYLTAYSTDRIVRIIASGRDERLSAFREQMTIRIEVDGCEPANATLTAHKHGSRTALRLVRVNGQCGTDDLKRDIVLPALDTALVKSLAAGRVKEGLGLLEPAVMLSTPAQTCPSKADTTPKTDPRRPRADANGETEYPPKTRRRPSTEAPASAADETSKGAEASKSSTDTPSSSTERAGD
jgi:hypothetical protein